MRPDDMTRRGSMEQILFRRGADRAIEKGDLDPAAAQLVHEQNLVRVVPGHAVRGVDVQAVDRPGRRLVVQPVQGRAQERAAAVPIVEEAELVIQAEPVHLDAGDEGFDLTGDGAGLGLLL